jgi:hypothetical protein
MKPDSIAYTHKAAKTFYYIAIASYTICLLFFLPDNLKYGHWGILKIDSITSVFVYTSFILFLYKKIDFKKAAFIYVYSALLNIVFSSWNYFYTLPGHSEMFLINTSIYCINLVFCGLCIGYRHAWYAAILYIAAMGPLLFISQEPSLNQYGIIICILITTFAAGISGFLFLLEKTYKTELQLREQVSEKEKALACEHEKLLIAKLDFRQREIMAKTMYLAENAESINNLIQKLDIYKTGLKWKEQKELDKIIDTQRINRREQCWKDFETCFLEVNTGFQQKLFEICPELSPSEHKLAKLIHLGLSSKQIASLNANTTESIEVARSRLRNKLKLPASTSLKTYLQNM